MRGMRKTNLVGRKREQEQKLSAWIAADANRQSKYGNALPELQKAYQSLDKVVLPVEYLRESILSVELLSLATTLDGISTRLEEGKTADATKALDNWQKALPEFYRNYDREVDRRMAKICLDAYLTDLPLEQLPDNRAMRAAKSAYGAGLNDLRFVNNLYAKSRLTSAAKAEALIADIRQNGVKAIRKEPAYEYVRDVLKMYRTTLLPAYQTGQGMVDLNLRALIEARRLLETDRKFWPDANSTFRIAYGQIKGYRPADGTIYEPFTFVDGVIEKRDTTVEEFNAPRRLVDLYNRKDFGRYADRTTGRLPLAFLATNHTTGGNSGSPVLNGKGELIGTNFDREWEGIMSDLAYSPELSRNISVDIRYTLWVIDKYANAGWLLGEMELVE